MKTAMVVSDFVYMKVLPTIICFGIIGNLLILLTNHFNPTKSTGFKYIWFLALSDLGACVMVIFWPVLHVIATNFRWNFASTLGWNSFLIYFVNVGINVFMKTSTLLTCSLTIDRYIALHKPLQYRKISIPKVVNIAVTLSFIIPVLFMCPRALQYRIEPYYETTYAVNKNMKKLNSSNDSSNGNGNDDIHEDQHFFDKGITLFQPTYGSSSSKKNYYFSFPNGLPLLPPNPWWWNGSLNYYYRDDVLKPPSKPAKTLINYPEFPDDLFDEPNATYLSEGGGGDDKNIKDLSYTFPVRYIESYDFIDKRSIPEVDKSLGKVDSWKSASIPTNNNNVSFNDLSSSTTVTVPFSSAAPAADAKIVENRSKRMYHFLGNDVLTTSRKYNAYIWIRELSLTFLPLVLLIGLNSSIIHRYKLNMQKRASMINIKPPAMSSTISTTTTGVGNNSGTNSASCHKTNPIIMDEEETTNTNIPPKQSSLRNHGRQDEYYYMQASPISSKRSKFMRYLSDHYGVRGKKAPLNCRNDIVCSNKDCSMRIPLKNMDDLKGTIKRSLFLQRSPPEAANLLIMTKAAYTSSPAIIITETPKTNNGYIVKRDQPNSELGSTTNRTYTKNDPEQIDDDDEIRTQSESLLKPGDSLKSSINVQRSLPRSGNIINDRQPKQVVIAFENNPHIILPTRFRSDMNAHVYGNHFSSANDLTTSTTMLNSGENMVAYNSPDDLFTQTIENPLIFNKSYYDDERNPQNIESELKQHKRNSYSFPLTPRSSVKGGIGSEIGTHKLLKSSLKKSHPGTITRSVKDQAPNKEIYPTKIIKPSVSGGGVTIKDVKSEKLKKHLKDERRLTIMLITIVGLHFVCNIPQAIVTIIDTKFHSPGSKHSNIQETDKDINNNNNTNISKQITSRSIINFTSLPEEMTISSKPSSTFINISNQDLLKLQNPDNNNNYKNDSHSSSSSGFAPSPPNYGQVVLEIALTLTNVLEALNFALNFYLYCIFIKDFRAQAKIICHKLTKHKLFGNYGRGGIKKSKNNCPPIIKSVHYNAVEFVN